MAKRRKSSMGLAILNLLMTYDGGYKPLTTNQICYLADCDRKTVYRTIADLEINGFGISVQKGEKNQSMYKLDNIYSCRR